MTHWHLDQRNIEAFFTWYARSRGMKIVKFQSLDINILELMRKNPYLDRTGVHVACPNLGINTLKSGIKNQTLIFNAEVTETDLSNGSTATGRYSLSQLAFELFFKQFTEGHGYKLELIQSIKVVRSNDPQGLLYMEIETTGASEEAKTESPYAELTSYERDLIEVIALKLAITHQWDLSPEESLFDIAERSPVAKHFIKMAMNCLETIQKYNTDMGFTWGFNQEVDRERVSATELSKKDKDGNLSSS